MEINVIELCIDWVTLHIAKAVVSNSLFMNIGSFFEFFNSIKLLLRDVTDWQLRTNVKYLVDVFGSRLLAIEDGEHLPIIEKLKKLEISVVV